MKKFLFLFMLSLGLSHLANAQAIKLIGAGVMGQSNPVLDVLALTSLSPGDIDHVVVEAAGVFRIDHGDPAPANVSFSDSNEGPISASFIDASPRNPDLDPNQKWGYYTATFNTVDGGGITLTNTAQEDYIVSFIAYVYLTDDAGVYSETKGDHAFLWKTGPAGKLTYTFTGIPTSSTPRNITISIPFSEVNQDGRWSVIEITPNDGSGTNVIDFDDNNKGQRLHIEEITIPDATGSSITEVEVSVYSPTITVDYPEGGDSFVLSPMLLSTTKDEEERGCTYTQGYWKTHSEYGPASKEDPTWLLLPNGPDTELYPGGESWYEVFWTSGSGNPYYPLAHQYMAAKLNLLSGTSSTPDVDAAILEADPIIAAGPLANITIEIMKNGKEKISIIDKDLAKKMVELASILADYNEGRIGPGHCDDEELEKSGEIARIKNVNFTIYPNPVRGNATLSFSPVNDGNAIVDIYSSTGQKSRTLFNQKVRKDVPVRFEFDGNQFNEGLYIIRFQNGSSSLTRKIQISR